MDVAQAAMVWKLLDHQEMVRDGKVLPFFETLKRRHIRSYDSANCSFDAVDFTVELNPFGAQVDEIIMRSSFGGFLKWGYPNWMD